MGGRSSAAVERADRLLIATPMLVETLLVRSGAPAARVYKTGMGPRRARAAAAALASEPGTRLLVVGFCGGLDDWSEPGEVIVADEVHSDPRAGPANEDPDQGRRKCADPGELAAVLGGRGLRIRRGPVVSVSRLALGEQRRELLEDGSIAVDMESLWLARGAGSRPFDVVRVVLDSPSHELLRPAAAVGALRAGGALRRVASGLREWASGERALAEPANGNARVHPDESSI